MEHTQLCSFELDPAWQPQQALPAMQPYPTMKPDFQRTWVKLLNDQCSQIWSRWECELSHTHANDVSIRVLTKALSNIVKLGTSVTIAVVPMTSPGVRFKEHSGSEPRICYFGVKDIIQNLRELSKQQKMLRELSDEDFCEVIPDWYGETLEEKWLLDGSGEHDTALTSIGESSSTQQANRATCCDGTRHLSRITGPNTPRDPANLVLAAMADSGMVPRYLFFSSELKAYPPPVLTTSNPRSSSISTAIARLTKLRLSLSATALEAWFPRSANPHEPSCPPARTPTHLGL